MSIYGTNLNHEDLEIRIKKVLSTVHDNTFAENLHDWSIYFTWDNVSISKILFECFLLSQHSFAFSFTAVTISPFFTCVLSAITVLIPNIYFRNTLDIFISSYIIQSCDFEMTFNTCASHPQTQSRPTWYNGWVLLNEREHFGIEKYAYSNWGELTIVSKCIDKLLIRLDWGFLTWDGRTIV